MTKSQQEGVVNTENTADTMNKGAVLRKLSKARAMVATLEWPMDGKIELAGRSIPYRSAEIIKKNVNKVLTEVGLEYVYNITDIETLPGFGGASNRLRGIFRLDLYDIDTGDSVTFSGPCEAGTSNDKASTFIHTNGYKAIMSTVLGINTDDDVIADDPDKAPASKFLNQGTKDAIKSTFASHKVGGTPVKKDPLFGTPKVVSKVTADKVPLKAEAVPAETPVPSASEVLKANPPKVEVISAWPASDAVPTKSDKAPISESQKKVINNTLRRLALTLPADKVKELEAERDQVFARNDADEANQWNVHIRSLA